MAHIQSDSEILKSVNMKSVRISALIVWGYLAMSRFSGILGASNQYGRWVPEQAIKMGCLFHGFPTKIILDCQPCRNSTSRPSQAGGMMFAALP